MRYAKVLIFPGVSFKCWNMSIKRRRRNVFTEYFHEVLSWLAPIKKNVWTWNRWIIETGLFRGFVKRKCSISCSKIRSIMLKIILPLTGEIKVSSGSSGCSPTLSAASVVTYVGQRFDTRISKFWKTIPITLEVDFQNRCLRSPFLPVCFYDTIHNVFRVFSPWDRPYLS